MPISEADRIAAAHDAIGTGVKLMVDCHWRFTPATAEAALRESRAKLEAALANMADAVFISDVDGRFLDFNEAFASFHRFPNKGACARTFAEYPDLLEVFLPGGGLAPIEQWAVPRALRGETAVNQEYGLRRKDTGETWVGSYNFASKAGSPARW